LNERQDPAAMVLGQNRRTISAVLPQNPVRERACARSDLCCWDRSRYSDQTSSIIRPQVKPYGPAGGATS
jgi:hypothetical protein